MQLSVGDTSICSAEYLLAPFGWWCIDSHGSLGYHTYSCLWKPRRQCFETQPQFQPYCHRVISLWRRHRLSGANYKRNLFNSLASLFRIMVQCQHKVWFQLIHKYSDLAKSDCRRCATKAETSLTALLAWPEQPLCSSQFHSYLTSYGRRGKKIDEETQKGHCPCYSVVSWLRCFQYLTRNTRNIEAASLPYLTRHIIAS